MLKKLWRKFSKVMFYFGIFIIMFFMVVAALVRIFEDDLKNYAVSHLDQYLNTKVYVQDVELSVWKKFPNASLEFKNVLIYDAYPDRIFKDTFFSARNLYLQFNIKDLIDGNYSITEVEANKSALNIKLNHKGEGNFNIVKKSSDTIKSNFDFALEKVIFKDLKFNYENAKLDQHYSADASELNLVGLFNQDSFSLESSSKLKIKKIRNKALTIIKNKEASFNLTLNVNHVDTSYHFNNGVFNIENMPFVINGYFDNQKIDFEATGKNITLDKLMHSVNKSISGDVYAYQSKGFLDFNFKVKGNPDDGVPMVTSDFTIKNGSITEPTKNLTVNNINLIGKYSNQKGTSKEYLEIKKLSAKTLNGTINGDLKIVNFSKPTLHTNLRGNADLKTLDDIFHFKGIETLSGKVDLYSQMTISINNPKYAPERFKILKNQGSLELKNVSIKPEGNHYFYEHIDGKMVLQGTDAVAKNLTLKIKETDLKINGSIKNLVPYLDERGKLNIIASLESNHLNTDNLILPPSSTKPSDTKLLPPNINLNLDLDINRLILGKQNFNKIHSKIRLLDQKLIVSKIYLEHAGGKMSGNLTFDTRKPQHSTVDANLRLTQININQLFRDWNNFDQKSITFNHVQGTANINTKVFAVLNEKNELVKDKLVAETKFNIFNGRLKNVPMMNTVSTAMRGNKMVKLFLKNHIDNFEAELKDLKFNTLSNTIYVKKGVVKMPKMNVSTNALNMNVSAEHDFDNNINYHFDFLFNDLKTKQQYTEFGKVEEDGTGFRIFLHMYGNLSDPQFGWDKEGKKQSKKENMEQEKATIKSMLKQEFGLFKKDSSINGYQPTPKKEEEFIFYDGEFEQKEEPLLIEQNRKQKKPKKNKEHSSKFLRKLEEEQKENKKNQEEEFLIGE